MLAEAKPSEIMRHGKNLLGYRLIPSHWLAVALPAVMPNTIDLR